MSLKAHYKLHPDYWFVHLAPSFNFKSIRALKALASVLGWVGGQYKPSANIMVDDVNIASGQDGYLVPVKVIKTKEGTSEEKRPCLVYFHGGAFYQSAMRPHFKLAEIYAQENNCVVIFPDYRLSLDHPFPSGLNDCYSALVWAEQNAEELGIEPSKIAVGGDSAGGCLAAAVALKARDDQGPKLCGQMLIYPVIDHQCKTDSAKKYTNTPIWNAISNRIMWDVYLRNSEGVSPYASPVVAQNLSGLPPTYIDVAEFDPLRDEGIKYGLELKRSGVDVVVANTKGTFHGYDALLSAQPAKESLARKVEALSSFFKGVRINKKVSPKKEAAAVL